MNLSNHSSLPLPTREDLLLSEQVRLLYGGLPLAIFSNIFLAAIMATVMLQAINVSWVQIWSALMSAAVVFRFFYFVLHKRAIAGMRLSVWLNRFRIGAIATGVIWGMSAPLFFTASDIAHQAFIAFVLAGVSSAAITSLAVDRVSALGFLLPALLPLVYDFISVGGLLPVSMGLMVTLFIIFLTMAAFRLQKNMQENIFLRAHAVEQQREISESESRFRQMLDTCPTAVRISQLDGQQIQYFNRSYAELINAAPEQVGVADTASYFASAGEYADVTRRLERGESVPERLLELHVPGSGGQKWVLASFLRIQFQGRLMVLGWFHDISERIRIERMKSEFVATVSHELRTPLTAISGALGLLQGALLGSLPEQAGSMLDIAQRNTQRLTFLINDLLDMEKLEAGKVNFDIKLQPMMPLIEQSAEAVAAQAAEHGVSIELPDGQVDGQIRVDAQRLMQVLVNFLSNAIKYSPKNGCVRISMVQAQGVLRVIVSDQGAGIPEQFRPLVFQKFAQADSSDTRSKGGTGLGLAISSELVKRMGGRIGFESSPGQGAQFYFEFPAN